MLAIESGISVSQWYAEDDRDLMTALDVLGRAREQEAKAAARAARGRQDDDEGRVMGGGG